LHLFCNISVSSSLSATNTVTTPNICTPAHAYTQHHIILRTRCSSFVLVHDAAVADVVLTHRSAFARWSRRSSPSGMRPQTKLPTSTRSLRRRRRDLPPPTHLRSPTWTRTPSPASRLSTRPGTHVRLLCSRRALPHSIVPPTNARCLVPHVHPHPAPALRFPTQPASMQAQPAASRWRRHDAT